MEAPEDATGIPDGSWTGNGHHFDARSAHLCGHRPRTARAGTRGCARREPTAAPGAPPSRAGALTAPSGWTVAGPFGRDDAHRAAAADVVLLCVPDAAIARRPPRCAPRPGRLVGHCSGATGLDVLLPHEGFSLHPLMTVTERGADLRGAGAAVDGATPRALEAARSLAAAVGLRAVRVAPEDRAAYHAAASVASNLLVTLEAAAERLAASAGVDRALLVPLVRATVENWAAHGPEAALTGPVARGDEATVARQREAVADRAPDSSRPSTSSSRPRARWPAGRRAGGAPSRRSRRHEDGADRRRPARRAAPAAPRGALDRPRADHGRAARRAPRARARALARPATSSSSRSSSTPRSSRTPATWPPTRATRPATPRWRRRPAPTCSSRPRPPRSTRRASPPRCAVDGPLTASLEGAHRGAAHFAAVATVVTKLLNMAQPDVAFFGQKDAQQVVVVRRVVRDLDLPVRIEVVPTVREPDGLALSSRNVHLRDGDRERALALSAALDVARERLERGERDATAVARAGAAAMRERGVDPEYLAVVDPRTLAPLDAVDGAALVAVAARVGPTRLIDNVLVELPREVLSMRRTLLKSKVHRATVTGSDLHYVGSITLDPDLLEAADILPHEQVDVVDVDNGARFTTYAIEGERGSGTVQINGAAARLVHTGDTVIVISYALYDADELASHEPRVVHVEAGTNRITTIDAEAATLLA